MTFLAPWAAWFLAGMPVIVLLYLLKLKRRPVTVSTLIFWNRVMRESRRRALFHKLRNLLSLLLHLLIFLLIIGALAKPVFDRFVRTGSSTVLIVDGRARMQAIEPGGESRFERARRSVAGYIRQARAARQIALLSVHASSQVMVPFTGDEKPLRAALDTLQVSDAAGDLEDALRLAEELLAARKGERRIVVFTDSAPLQPPGAARNSAIDFVALGTPRENIAITRFAARPLITSPDTSELLIELRNFSMAAARGNIELALDGKLLDVRPFEIEAGGRKLDVFPSVPRPGNAVRGWLTARLDGTDALAADNVAYASLPPPQPSRVLLVTRGNWFLEKLLAADQQVKFELLEPQAFQLAMAAQFDVVILDKFVPAGFELGRSPGNVLFIKESPFAESAPPLEQPVITDIDTAHPVMRLVDWQNVTILRATALRLPPSADGWAFHSPLRAFEHPLLLVGARQTSGAAQRVAALAFDVADSDLPLRVAFPLLMANTVHWLAAQQSSPVLAVRAGESLTLEPGQAVSTKPQTKMDASAKPSTMARDLFVPLENGFYLMEQPAGRQWVAVNTFSEGESDLRGAGKGSAVARPGLPRMSLVNAASWPFWQYLALAALLLSTVEWWLFHRRRTE